MSDIDLAVRRSQQLEQRLEGDLGATGKGLHQKVSSVEAALPRELVRKLRLVATVRNKVVHESPRIDDRAAFVQAADDAERELKALRTGRRGRWGKRTLTLVALIALAAIVILMVLATRG